MEMMDSTIIATSLPAIAIDLNTDPIALKLAMTSYLVALTIFIPISGWVGDRFGARRVFIWSLVVFTIGSVACALAYSLPTFVGARFLQGIGGSMMSPLARLVLMRTTPRNQMVNAVSWLTVPALVGPMVGPPIGGFLTTYFSWHWIFLVNVPIGIFGVVAASIFLPAVTAPKPGRIDWLGFALTAIASSGIILGLSVISLASVPSIVAMMCIAIGVLALAGYIYHAQKNPHPLLDLAIFKSGVYRAIEIGSMLLRLAMGAWTLLLPLMLQIAFGLTALDTGIIMLYAALSSLLAKFIVPYIFVRFSFRAVMAISGIATVLCLSAAGFFDINTPIWVMAVFTFGSGFCRSVFFSGSTAVSISELPDRLTGHATAVSSVLWHSGLALGVAMAGILLSIVGADDAHGGTLKTENIQMVFFIAGGIAMFCMTPFLFLSRDAGANMSGRRISETPG